MEEIFLPITNNIVDNIAPYYLISNYGNIHSIIYDKKLANKLLNKRYKINLQLLNSIRSPRLDVATLVYCTFNNIKYYNYLLVDFIDNNPNNMYIENLYNLKDIRINNIVCENKLGIINHDISKSEFCLKKDIKQMCYFIDEQWIDITDNEVKNIKPIYMISNYGRIYNKQNKSMLYLQISYNGYINAFVKSINNNYINISIHRTMMKCFRPLNNYNNMEVNHKDCNSFNNSLNNLEWLTSYENEHYIPDVIPNPHLNRSFTYEEVNMICEALQNNMSYEEICFYILHAKYIGSLHARISEIHRRIKYTFISKNYVF